MIFYDLWNIYDYATNLPILKKTLMGILQLIKSWIKARDTCTVKQLKL